MNLFKQRQVADRVLVPLTVGEAARLISLAERAASARGMRLRYDGRGALVGDDGMTAGLTNLARALSGEARRHWSGLIEEHFERIATMASTLDADLRGPSVSDRLYLRLMAINSLPPGWQFDSEEFVPGVRIVPASYSDHAVAIHTDLGPFGLTDADVTRIGLANLRRIPDEVGWLRDDGADVAFITGSMFSASRALVLDTVLRETLRVENPSFGTLVAFPIRDLLMVHILRDEGVVAAMDVMVSTAIEAFTTQPGPISPHVYYAAPRHSASPAAGSDSRASAPEPDSRASATGSDSRVGASGSGPRVAASGSGPRVGAAGWQQVTDCSDGTVRVVLDGPLLTAVRRLSLAGP